MTRKGHYDFKCYDCEQVELRYCNSRRCRKCGGSIYRLDDPPTLPLQKIGQGMALLIEGLLEQRQHVPHIPPLSVDIMCGPFERPFFFTTVGNEWRCWGADDQDPGEAIADAVAEAVDHLSDPEKHYTPDVIHTNQVEIACAAHWETGLRPGQFGWREIVESSDHRIPGLRKRMHTALLALLAFSRDGYGSPRAGEADRAIDREEDHMTPEDLIAALKPLEGHWCRMISPGPPVPFVHDFPVATVQELSPEQSVDDVAAHGCDVIIWTGQFVGGGNTLSGWALPSSQVAEAEWDAVGVRLRKVRGRRRIRIKILDDPAGPFSDLESHPVGYDGPCNCATCRSYADS